MVLTPSRMVPLGTKAPDFELFDVVSQKVVCLEKLKSNIATVVMFICNHCPYVHHIQNKLVSLANFYIPKGVSFIAISSNDAKNYPEDSPKEMKRVAEHLHYPFPFLYDETQEVARAYGATCTPDFFIFDRSLFCVYRGQMDDSRPGNGIEVTGKDLKDALECLLHNRSISPDQKPSIGCNIKWETS